MASCECPYQDELDRAQQRKSSTVDEFYAEKLWGTWQCYYPMIIGGLEFKQIYFMPNGKADIVVAKPHETEWNTYTYTYAYYGHTLRLSYNGTNISLDITGYLFPELYLRDSYNTYTIAKRKSYGC